MVGPWVTSPRPPWRPGGAPDGEVQSGPHRQRGATERANVCSQLSPAVSPPSPLHLPDCTEASHGHASQRETAPRLTLMWTRSSARRSLSRSRTWVTPCGSSRCASGFFGRRGRSTRSTARSSLRHAPRDRTPGRMSQKSLRPLRACMRMFCPRWCDVTDRCCCCPLAGYSHPDGCRLRAN